MKPIQHILIGMLGGALITGGALGTLGFLKIQDLSHENSTLTAKVKKLSWLNQNLSKSQTNLSAELENIKTQREQGYDQTIDALMQAKENASTQALYEMGLKAYKEKDYPNAYFALDQVFKDHPKYKEIAQLYPEVKQAYDSYQKSQREIELAATYGKALDAQAHHQYAQAEAHYRHVLKLDPHYKDAQTRLKAVSLQVATIQQSKDLEQKKQWLAKTYQVGLQAQSLGRYAQAKEAFENIVHYAPAYKDTAQRLKVVRAKLPKPAPALAARPGLPGMQVNCYEAGVAMARCAKSGAPAQNCVQSEMANITACKGKPEFQQGLKSIMGAGSLPGNDPLMGGGALPTEPGGEAFNDNTLSLIKNFPKYLKNL